jgi:translation initiation factor IF-2
LEKLTVKELSKELKIPGPRLVRMLKDLGFAVQNYLSEVEPDAREKILARLKPDEPNGADAPTGGKTSLEDRRKHIGTRTISDQDNQRRRVSRRPIRTERKDDAASRARRIKAKVLRDAAAQEQAVVEKAQTEAAAVDKSAAKAKEEEVAQAAKAEEIVETTAPETSAKDIAAEIKEAAKPRTRKKKEEKAEKEKPAAKKKKASTRKIRDEDLELEEALQKKAASPPTESEDVILEEDIERSLADRLAASNQQRRGRQTQQDAGTGSAEDRKAARAREEFNRQLVERKKRRMLEVASQPLLGGGKGRRRSSRIRGSSRRKRSAASSHARGESNSRRSVTVSHVTIDSQVSIKELSALTGIRSAEIISFLMRDLDLMVNINAIVDADVAGLILENWGIEYEVKSSDVEDVLHEHDEVSTENMSARCPIVTVMGHVDHGKTKLLDAIRETKVADQEAGGITQHVGAYQVSTDKGMITFIDTPGHEAFTQMRARGAKVTDIAVLVVAADDGVMPQTVEALDHARAAEVEIVVAINKIDKPEANVEKVKAQLAELGLQPAEWGGSTEMIEISAKQKINIDSLLDTILTVAELLELQADYEAHTRGIIVEARLDKGRGAVASAIVQQGTLHPGDVIVAGNAMGKVRELRDGWSRSIEDAIPGTPVEISGFKDVPQAGDTLYVLDDEKTARAIVGKRLSADRQEKIRMVNKVRLDTLYDAIKEGEAKELALVIKGDVQGSIEALSDALQKLSVEDIKLNIIHSSVGNIRETDILLASASNAVVIGFNVEVSQEAKRMADREGVDLRRYNIIYKVTEDIEKSMKGLLEPIYEEREVGTAEVLAIFKKDKNSVVAGMKVLTGQARRGVDMRVYRDDEQVHEGKLESLRRFKDSVKEVESGYECGLSLTGFNDLQEGDRIQFFEVVELSRF